MDVKLLKTFVAAVQYSSLTHVAKAFGVSQPAVSVQISRLEEQIGFKLFSRINGRLRPTQAGMVFYTEVNKALGGIERLAQSALDIGTGQLGTVIVAAHPAAAISLLPGVVAQFSRERSGVVVRILSRHSQVLSQMMPPQSFDIGIAELPLDDKAVSLRRFSTRCVAIVPTAHPLAQHTVLTPALLSRHPFVGTPASHLVSLRMRQLFDREQAVLNTVAESEMFATTCGLVAGGVGWAIVDPLSARTFCLGGLEIRPFEPTVGYDIGVFHALEREPSMLTTALLDALYAALEPFKIS